MQYVPFASDLEVGFYTSLSSHKINHDKLDDSARRVLGVYEIRPADAKEHSCRMQLRANAFTSDDVPNGCYRAEGMIKNVNTIEDYKNLDKMALLRQAGQTMWDAINDGTIYSCPSLLASFLIISFADLKKYRISYWCAFPAFTMERSWTPVVESGIDSGKPYKRLTPTESTALVDAVQTWRYSVDSRQHGFFLAKKTRKPQIRPPNPLNVDDQPDTLLTPDTPVPPSVQLGYSWAVAPLAAYESGFFEGEYSHECYVCFVDPSNFTEESGTVAPGWMLRNLLVLARQRWKRDRIQVMCYRDVHGRRDAARTITYDLELSRQPRQRANTKDSTATTSSAADESSDSLALPKVVGWERDERGKLAGRYTDLNEYMDPRKMADQSVDLNLKLMKWRIAPGLDLEKIKNTKCLLLGAGTLGSYVSRNLLGWGVRKITFVDNATVSFSNPVRQPLFNFEDCIDGGKRKAIRAAEALKAIYPGVDASGHVMSVPMAGHPVPSTEAEKVKAEFEKLEQLIKEHDAIFLLMDSRESRWLPTVIGKAENKIVMNAALGFDTYVVMRHGMKPLPAMRPRSPTSQKQTVFPIPRPSSSASHGPGSDGDSMPPRSRRSSSKASQENTRPQVVTTASQFVPSNTVHPSQSPELGCYFCNDVVAPSNSTKDLTLDQQCTVTRPGIAAIASALLVEVLVSLLQHPLGAAAPAPAPGSSASGPSSSAFAAASSDGDTNPLGLVPHQIRGFLRTFSALNVVGRAYDCCSACSDRVLDTYRRDGWSFVEKALNDKDYVEELSGLKEVQRLAEQAALAMEADDEEDDFNDDDEGGDGELI